MVYTHEPCLTLRNKLALTSLFKAKDLNCICITMDFSQTVIKDTSRLFDKICLNMLLFSHVLLMYARRSQNIDKKLGLVEIVV